MTVQLFKEDVNLDLRGIVATKKWIQIIAINHSKAINEINYIFCSDEYLHKINIEYLHHDTFTDIITFDNREKTDDPIEADIFISLERVTDNATNLGVDLNTELYRVMAHGLLHLIGFKDKTKAEQQAMRTAEDEALKLK